MLFPSLLRGSWSPICERWLQLPSTKYFSTTGSLCNRLQPPTILTEIFGGKRRNSTSEICGGNDATKLDLQKANYA